MYNAESFHGTENPDQNIETDLETTKAEARAREIATSGDYEKINKELREGNLLENEVKRVKNEYKEELDNIEFLTKQDLEIFTILELYDKDLALHSIETYKIAKDKITRPLAFNVILADLCTKEGVTPAQFFRACFLHDIGKVTIPNFVLNNMINFKEMSKTLSKLLNEEDEATINNIKRRTGTSVRGNKEIDIIEFLDQHHLRPVHVVPVQYTLTKEEMKAFERYGISPDLSIMDIIEPHEIASGKILTEAGLEIEGDLAGSHHNYHGRGSSFPLTLEAFRLTVDMAELIRIADMTEALTATRSYKKGNSRVHANRMILDSVKNSNYISEAMTYIWIEDEIKKFEYQPEESFTEEDKNDIKYLKEQLELMKENINENSLNIRKVA